MSRPLPDDAELNVMLDALRDRGLDDLAGLVLELVAAERERVAIASSEDPDEITTPLLLAGYLHGLAGVEWLANSQGRTRILRAAAMLARLGGTESIAELIEEEIDPPTRD